MDIALSNHEKISPTAKMVAYSRQFTDIPFSKDIAELFGVNEVSHGLFDKYGKDFANADYFTYLTEIRYKCIENYLKSINARQVLEFASGISLRGLSMTEDSGMIYVETDLEGLTSEKIHLVEKIMQRHAISKRDNLFFGVANILDFEEIKPHLAHFDRAKPVAIVHEGLLPYLTIEEKVVAAKNIRKILDMFGGVWITPDLDSKERFNRLGLNPEEYKTMSDRIAELTGRDFAANTFDTDKQTEQFLIDAGFVVEVHPQLTPDLHLSSSKGQDISEKLLGNLRDLNLWVMTSC